NRADYLNVPRAILVVVMEEPEAQIQWDEKFGATASMIQNLWLLAWEQDLGMVWKTNAHVYNPEGEDIMGVEDHGRMMGFIHMGYFHRMPIKKHRISVDDKFQTYQG